MLAIFFYSVPGVFLHPGNDANLKHKVAELQVAVSFADQESPSLVINRSLDHAKGQDNSSNPHGTFGGQSGGGKAGPCVR
jgi:hypothetical protein